ncbi:DUF6262 family protein [Nonomuraea sp. NEAU-A123]|uniref:DUF6262 family protein n=1 Tax=Nonomuraea sp. NEAU-A123 TaxID=2839649 RepID=UPI001BE49E97|nr:DUF6262 family protein [Nonomuraea sp. NEAU-A123]MBT2225065.1 hypothetical protein [Nonomuraea sp. NEAU-A123]
MPPADNARFLIEASKQRHQQARHRAQDAITAAERRGDRPTVVGIAEAAAVSRSWLYTQPDLIEAIGQLRQRTPKTSRSRAQGASEASLQSRLETALERNRQLRAEVADLTARLEAVHGELRKLRIQSTKAASPLIGPC